MQTKNAGVTLLIGLAFGIGITMSIRMPSPPTANELARDLRAEQRKAYGRKVEALYAETPLRPPAYWAGVSKGLRMAQSMVLENADWKLSATPE